MIENKYLDEDGYKVIIKFVCYWFVKYYLLKLRIWEFEEFELDVIDYYKKVNIWWEKRKIEDELYYYERVLEIN